MTIDPWNVSSVIGEVSAPIRLGYFANLATGIGLVRVAGHLFGLSNHYRPNIVCSWQSLTTTNSGGSYVRVATTFPRDELMIVGLSTSDIGS